MEVKSLQCLVVLACQGMSDPLIALTVGMGSCLGLLANTNCDRLMQIKDKCRVYQCVQKPGELLYVPQGWVMVDSTKPNTTTFDIRKTVFFATQWADEALDMCIRANTSDSKSSGKLTKIHELLEAKLAGAASA